MADEKINEVLGIEENSEAKDSTSQEVEALTNNAAENTLKTVANIVLWIGCIGTFFCLCFCTHTTTKVVDPTYEYIIHYDSTFNPAGLAVSVGVLLSSVTTWAVLKVIANISISLKEINSKIK